MKHLDKVTRLFEAYSILSTCSNSHQSIANNLLPGLCCLRGDFIQYRPDSVGIIDAIIQDVENQLVQNFSLTDSTYLNADQKRGRVMKSFEQLRDSTEKLTHRWIKRK